MPYFPKIQSNMPLQMASLAPLPVVSTLPITVSEGVSVAASSSEFQEIKSS